MDAGVVHTAYEAIQKSISLLDDETQREKDFVMALSERYSAEAMEDRTPLDQAYSDAMRNLSNKYPDDLDAATMFAESIMDLSSMGLLAERWNSTTMDTGTTC